MSAEALQFSIHEQLVEEHKKLVESSLNPCSIPPLSADTNWL